MSSHVYEDVSYFRELGKDGGEREEQLVEIYESVGDDRDHADVHRQESGQ